MIFRIKIFGIFRFPNKKNFEFFFINSSSISKKIKFFFSKCRQKFQKSYIFCTWFRQFSSSESFKKQVSTPAMLYKTDCTCTSSIFFRYKVQNKQNSSIFFRYKFEYNRFPGFRSKYKCFEVISGRFLTKMTMNTFLR